MQRLLVAFAALAASAAGSGAAAAQKEDPDQRVEYKAWGFLRETSEHLGVVAGDVLGIQASLNRLREDYDHEHAEWMRVLFCLFVSFCDTCKVDRSWQVTTLLTLVDNGTQFE